jgi:RsiW-degrading membrane proteinase PrsW (M82 family)
VQQGLFNGSFDPQSLTIDWMSLLQRPAVVGAILLAAVLVVPLIEELLKPLGVWVLKSRGLSPAGGFTAGMICGAIFALLESLFSLSAISGEEWLYTVVGRVGTGLLHLALTGFNGWALAASWRDGRYLRIGITYILTVLVHGVWNLFAMLMGLNMVGDELELNVNPVLTASAPWVLVALAFAILAALFLLNRHLRHAQTPVSSPPPLPVTTERLE